MAKRPIILFRHDPAVDDAEVRAMHLNFPTITSRLDIKANDLVVGRLSVLPFYKELEIDVRRLGAELLNSYRQHRYIADVGAWYPDLEDLTAPTFTSDQMSSLQDNDDFDGFVLKGETNSRKFLWNSHMYAPTTKELVPVFLNLVNDALIGSQQIYIRRKLRLKTFLHSENGLPITNEYRVFVARKQILCVGFYWSSYADQIPESQRIPPPSDFLANVVEAIGDAAPGYVVDVGLMADEVTWKVIELNDLQMSGISENDPYVLYKMLADVLRD